jgi:glycosyltransferase involved in cell wall biosynthesis
VRVISGLMFFPRGGSAHVARALAHELPAMGWDVTVVSGSLPGYGDARAFYAGLDVRPVDFAAGDAPMHPSFEDRPGAPDPVFAAVDDAAYERHVEAWARALDDAGAADADVLHLHHLTPLDEAAARVAPDVPVVGHLHGTELLMLERIAAGPPAGWSHAGAWSRRMRRWAARCERLVLLSGSQVARARDLLGVDPSRCVVCPNGFDPDAFRPAGVDRAAHWRRHLVTEPHGWRPGGEEGSVAYSEAEIVPLARGPILLAVGRFTEVKRLGLLVRAFAAAQQRVAGRPSLVLLGGHPGEWEDEHPLEVIQGTGTSDVFLAGWHDHAALPEFFNASDAVVMASVAEQFGLVLVEGMACGLPAVAVDRLGPADIVTPGETGWLVPPDDVGALASALAAVVNDAAERRRRGARAREDVLERFAWPALAERLGATLEDAAQSRAEGLSAQK